MASPHDIIREQACQRGDVGLNLSPATGRGRAREDGASKSWEKHTADQLVDCKSPSQGETRGSSPLGSAEPVLVFACIKSSRPNCARFVDRGAPQAPIR